MEPVKGMQLDLPSYVVTPINLSTMISNVFSIYTGSVRRAARMIPIQTLELVKLLKFALQDPDKWSNAILDISTAPNFWDARRKMTEVAPVVQELVSVLFRPPVLIPDLGECDTNAILEGGEKFWQADQVISPQMGYVHECLKLTADHGLNGVVFEGRRFVGHVKTTSVGSNWNQAIAVACCAVDRVRFGPNLIPKVDAIGKLDAKDQPFGTIVKTSQQLRRLHAIFSLYLVQGSLIIAHANAKLLRTEWDIAYALEERARPALDAYRGALDKVLSIPLHPLLAYIANGLQTGTIDTFFGSKDNLYRVGSMGAASAPLDRACDDRDSEFRDSVLQEAQEDALKTPFDIAKDGRVAVRCHDLVWDWESDEQIAQQPLSYGDLARIVIGAESLTEHWDSVAGELGWTKPSTDIGEINAYGCDFVLTDGESFSASAGGVVLGMRPCLPINNVKIAGIARRHEDFFNVGGKIDFSTIGVIGSQGVTGEGDQIERLFIPIGMHMGESDTHVLTTNGALEDTTGRLVITHFSAKASEYLDTYYTDIDEPEAPVIQTDWDPIGHISGSQSPAALAVAWKQSITGQSVETSKSMFLTRTTGKFFAHRIPVFMARKNEYELYNEVGGFREIVAYEGHVDFNAEISVTVGNGDVEAIPQLAPPSIKTGIGEIDKALSGTT